MTTTVAKGWLGGKGKGKEKKKRKERKKKRKGKEKKKEKREHWQCDDTQTTQQTAAAPKMQCAAPRRAGTMASTSGVADN